MKIIIKMLGVLVASFALLVAWLLTTEWHPLDEERTIYNDAPYTPLCDTLKLVSWNIGYAGLGEDMDFFYDGGVQTRTSKEQTQKNLDAIIAQLQTFDDADFILLQEVDFYSKRSYHIDLFEAITSALNYPYSAVALNYLSPYVPIPIDDPIGGVKSGIVTLSKYPIVESIRRQYPSLVELPNRLFDLKRSMLSVAIRCSENDILWINNTHNSAFDTGEKRRVEIQFIDNVICENPRCITAGDWNSTPPNFTPSKEAMENKFFAPLPLSLDDLSMWRDKNFDPIIPTVRYLDYPYSSSKCATTVVDFAVSGDKCRIIEAKTLDLRFKNSDHNPIVITFILKN